jgi:hypothetical protein
MSIKIQPMNMHPQKDEQDMYNLDKVGGGLELPAR